MRLSRIKIRIAAIVVAGAIGLAMAPASRTIASGVSPALGATSSIWPAVSHDRAHTGRSQFDTNANPGALKWKFGTAGGVTAPAIGADSTIYVGSGDSNLYAVLPDGIRKWAFKADTPIGSPAIADDGTVYFRGGENLYAVDPKGAKKWVFATGAGAAAPAIGVDGTIYVANDETLYSLNRDGAVKWKCALGYAARSSPTIGADGTIYIGSGDGNLYATSSDGKKKWAFATGSFVDSSPAIGADGTIYVGSGYPNARLYAVTPQGARVWEFASPAGASFSSPAIGADGTIYVGCYDGSLYAIDSGGTKRWALAIGVVGNVAPAIGADGTIYIGSDDYNLHAIKPDGSEKWRFAIGSDVHSAVAIGADGTIYIGSNDHSLYAVGVAPPGVTARPRRSKGPIWPTFHHDPARTGRSEFDTGANTGALKWTFAITESFAYDYVTPSPAIGADGTIYIGSQDHNLFAVNADGTERWKFAAGGGMGFPAVGVDGTIYAGSTDGNLYAVNPDGKRKWIFPIPHAPYEFVRGAPEAPAIGTDGTIFVAAGSYLSAVSSTGALEWKFAGDGQVTACGAIGADGTIYAGFDKMRVIAGIAHYSGRLCALKPDGSLKWQFTTQDALSASSPTISNDGTVYVGSNGTLLYAIGPSGRLNWKLATGKGSGLCSSPAIGADGTVYAVSCDHMLYAVKADGTVKWKFAIGNPTAGSAALSSPAISADGTIFIGSGSEGQLYAINPDGRLKWKFEAGTFATVDSSPAIGSDGTVYFIGGGGNLYAVGAAVESPTH